MPQLLARDVFVTLSFHAKMHQLLDKFAPGFTPIEKEHIMRVGREDAVARFEDTLATIFEKIEKKQLANDPVDDPERFRQLQALKREAYGLKVLIDEMRAEEMRKEEDLL